jgi:hypothetical protein
MKLGGSLGNVPQKNKYISKKKLRTQGRFTFHEYYSAYEAIFWNTLYLISRTYIWVPFKMYSYLFKVYLQFSFFRPWRICDTRRSMVILKNIILWSSNALLPAKLAVHQLVFVMTHLRNKKRKILLQRY